MKEKIICFLTITLVTLWSTVFTSCDNEPYDDNIEKIEDSKKDSQKGIDIDKLIKQCVSVDIDCLDFYWHITFKSTLEDYLPGTKIKYGMEFWYHQDINKEDGLRDNYGYIYADNNNKIDVIVFDDAGLNSNGTDADALGVFYYGRWKTLTEKKQKGELIKAEEEEFTRIYNALYKLAKLMMDDMEYRFFVEIDKDLWHTFDQHSGSYLYSRYIENNK